MTRAQLENQDPGTGSPGRGPTRLYLVRHGEVEGQGHLHGHVDVALTPRGLEQLERVAERLAGEPLAAVYCSDLQRSRRGAEAVARGRGIDPEPDQAFRELDMGDLDGRPMEELWTGERALLQSWWDDLEAFVLPGGESLGQLRSRVLGAFGRLLARHAGESFCLVAHGGVNRVILFEAMGLPLAHYHRVAQEYGCLNLVEYYPGGKAVVRLVNG
ncbi:MAG: histidine phosphatase family protein [Deferrisomatales bacterium]